MGSRYYVPQPGAAAQQYTPVELPPLNAPPEDANYFDYGNSIPLPALGVTATVLQFQIPEGKRGVIWRLANVVLGGGFQDFSGNLVWRVFKNPPQAVQNYENILYSLGSLANPCPTFIPVDENDVIQITITTVVVAGGGMSTAVRAAGWWFSRERI
jgi:hypothetical protein